MEPFPCRSLPLRLGCDYFVLTWSFIKCLKEAAQTVVKLLHCVPVEEGSSRHRICLFAALVGELDK